MRTSALTLTTALMVSLVPAPARSESAEEKARKLFEDARTLSDKGKWAEACPKFREAHELHPTGGTSLQLATCYERVGNVREALYYYKKLRDNPDEKNQERKDIATERVKALEERLAREGTPPPAPTPPPSPAPPPSASPAPTAKEEPAPVPPPKSDPRWVAGGVVLGVGGGALVAGAILGGVALSEMRGVWTSCSGGSCPPAQKPVADGALVKANAADATFAIAGVAIVTGVILIATVAAKRSPERVSLGGFRF